MSEESQNTDRETSGPETEARQYRYPSPRYQRQVDGGYSGDVTGTAAEGKDGAPTIVFVDSPLLDARLVLTPAQAAELATALHEAEAAANGLPAELGRPARGKMSDRFIESPPPLLSDGPQGTGSPWPSSGDKAAGA